MPVNTALIAEITPTNATYTAEPILPNETLLYWFNDAAPSNSLVFVGVGSLITFWRGDFRNGGSFTEANRTGQFRQTNDLVSSDIQFFFSNGVGYLLTCGNRGNIWVYAFNPSTVLGGSAVVAVDANTTSANLLANSTTLDLNNGNGTFQTAPSVGDTFTLAGSATVYTLSSAQIITLIGNIAVGTNPRALAYIPSTDRVMVVNSSTNNVSVINPATSAVVATITVGTSPFASAYIPSTDRVMVVNSSTNNVSVINPATSAVVATITVGNNPRSVTYVPSNDRVMVANQTSGTVSVINPATSAVVATIAVGSVPVSIAYVPSTDRVMVANDGNNVSVINPATSAVVATITVGTNPRSIAYVPSTDRVMVTNNSSNNVSVINPASSAIVATITVGSAPVGITYVPSSDRVMVTNFSAANVSAINPATNAVVATITVGSAPIGTIYVPSTDRVMVANFSNNNVSVINPRSNQIDANTRARIVFSPGLAASVAIGDSLQFWGAGNKFVTARLRLAADGFPSATRLAPDLANGFLAAQNASTVTFYRDLVLASFDGTNNVTVNGISIAPNTSTTVGYYSVTTPVFSIAVTARDIKFYYKAGTSYLITTSTTNQLFLYAFNAATVNSAPAVKATFTTNGLSASLPRHLSLLKVGSDLILLVVGDTVNLLYRFADSIFDGTGTITINDQSIVHSSGYAVPTSAALFYWIHNTTATDSILGALYYNTNAARLVLAFVTAASVDAYELNLDSFTGTTTVNVKGVDVAPTNRQYTLPEYLSSFQIPGYRAPLLFTYNNASANNSFISGNASRIAPLSGFGRFNTVIDLLTQSYTAAPAITKASATAPLILSTEITAFQALSILTLGSSLVSLQNADGSTGYANGEFYPYGYTATDDAAGTLTDSFSFSGSSAGITGTYRLTMASGKTLTLATKGTYNDSFTVSSGATLSIAQNTTLGNSMVLHSGATVVASDNVGPFTLTIPYADPGLIYDPTKINIVSQIRLIAPNFADTVRAYGARVQSFSIASTAINTSTDTITLGNDSQGNAAVFATAAPWTQVSFRLASGATLPATTGSTLVDGGFYYWSGGKLYTSIANIPATPVDFTSQGSGNFILQAETELFNTVVSGGSGLSQNLSLPNGALVRVKATYWAEAGGTATAGQFYDTRDGLLIWSTAGGITIGATVGPTVLEPIHEQIVSATQIFSNKFGTLTPANSGSTLSQFSIALEGIGTLQINSNDPDGVELLQNIFLWWCWIRSTQAGIRLASYDTLQATSFTSYQAGRVEVENTNSSLPLNIAGGSITFPGTSSGIAVGSFAININADVFGTGAATGLTATEIRSAVGLTAPNLDNQLTGISTKTGALPASFPANFPDLAITASTGQVTVGTLANNSITAAVIATDAIDADAIAADAVTEIQAGLATQASVNAIPTTPAPTAAQNASQVRTELTTELARIDATISSRLASSGYTTPPTTGQIRTELATELARIDVATSTRLAAADYTAPPTAAQNATQVRTELGTELARIDTSISSRSTLTAAQIRTELATELARLDVAVSTRLATAGYTTPPTTAQIATAVEAALLNDADGQALLAAIQTAVQALFDQQADVPVATLVSLIAAQITTDHGSGSYTTANTAALALETSVQAIKTKTDSIPANPLLTTDARLSSLDATISSRASQASVNAIPTTPAPTAAQNASQVRAELGTELARLDVAVSSRSTLTAGDIPAGLSAQQVWEYATRQLTGTQASNLAVIPNIPTNPLLSSAYTPPPSAATIADAVWDETLSQHLTAGSTGAKLNLASTLTVGDIPAGLSAQQVWEYATRTLSVASGLTNAQELKLNELHRKAGLDPAAPVTRTLNPSTGNVAETFTGVAINHVETGTTVVTTRQP